MQLKDAKEAVERLLQDVEAGEEIHLQLHGRIDSLREDRERQAETIRELQQMVKDLRVQREAAKRYSAEVCEENDMLQNYITELKREVAKLRCELTESDLRGQGTCQPCGCRCPREVGA